MGTWILDPREDITLERPASMAKRFTFYRVATALKEAGTESGRKENGVVRCVFTPDKEGKCSGYMCACIYIYIGLGKAQTQNGSYNV